MDEEWLSVAQAARRMNVSPRHVVRLIRCGRLAAMNVGTGRRHHEYRIDPAALAALAVPPPALPRDPQPRRRRLPPFVRIARV